MSTVTGLPSGAQILRTLMDRGIWQKQHTENVCQRMLVWFFGMTVIGERVIQSGTWILACVCYVGLVCKHQTRYLNLWYGLQVNSGFGP